MNTCTEDPFPRSNAPGPMKLNTLCHLDFKLGMTGTKPPLHVTHIEDSYLCERGVLEAWVRKPFGSVCRKQ